MSDTGNTSGAGGLPEAGASAPPAAGTGGAGHVASALAAAASLAASAASGAGETVLAASALPAATTAAGGPGDSKRADSTPFANKPKPVLQQNTSNTATSGSDENIREVKEQPYNDTASDHPFQVNEKKSADELQGIALTTVNGAKFGFLNPPSTDEQKIDLTEEKILRASKNLCDEKNKNKEWLANVLYFSVVLLENKKQIARNLKVTSAIRNVVTTAVCFLETYKAWWDIKYTDLQGVATDCVETLSDLCFHYKLVSHEHVYRVIELEEWYKEHEPKVSKKQYTADVLASLVHTRNCEDKDFWTELIPKSENKAAPKAFSPVKQDEKSLFRAQGGPAVHVADSEQAKRLVEAAGEQFINTIQAEQAWARGTQNELKPNLSDAEKKNMHDDIAYHRTVVVRLRDAYDQMVNDLLQKFTDNLKPLIRGDTDANVAQAVQNAQNALNALQTSLNALQNSLKPSYDFNVPPSIGTSGNAGERASGVNVPTGSQSP